MRYVIGIGEALWDVFPDGAQLGGAPANFAFHAARCGFKSLAISSLGQDALGDETLAAFSKKELNVLMPRVDFPTGTVQVSLDAKGVPSYNICEGVAWDNMPFTSEMQSVAQSCLAVCWGSLAQRSAVSRNTINRFLDSVPADALKVFDINLRQHYFTKEIIEQSLYRCNILKINDEEWGTVQSLLNLPSDTLQATSKALMERYNIEIVVLTCGTEGSHVFTTSESSFLPTPRVTVVDTVGAGDSFTAAFVSAILEGKTIKESHQQAVTVSAQTCTHPGAM